MRNIFVYGILVLSIACNGSGGGGNNGGSSSTPKGSVVFENFSSMHSQSNVCLGYSQPTTQLECTDYGGIWNASRNIVTVTTGSYDTNYNMSCSSGSAIATPKCTIGSVAFSATAGLSNSSVYACTANNGTVSISCAEVTGSEMIGTCSGATPTDQSECQAMGGVFHATLHNATGSITHLNLIAGSNTVQTLIDPNVDAVDVMSLNPQEPVYFEYTAKIKNYSNITFWSIAKTVSTNNEFESTGYYENFTIISDVGTSSNSNGSVVVESAKLYFK